jgi:hypothetical protein
MKKFLVFSLSMCFILSISHAQQLSLHPKPVQKNAIQKDLVQKAVVNWNVQFLDTLNPGFTFPIAVVSDDSYLYFGCLDQDKIYISNFNSDIIDSIEPTGMPGASVYLGMNITGLTYDGQYFYMTNSNDTIYQIDPTINSVINKIPLPDLTVPFGITYAPDADNGNGAFWVSILTDYGLKLFSKSGVLLDSIFSSDLHFSGISGNPIYSIAYDNISPGGPFIYTIEPNPHYVVCIKPATKKIYKMIYNIDQDVSAWDTINAYSIYIQTGIVPGTSTLGIINAFNHHIGYDLASTDIPDLSLTCVNSYTKPWLKIAESAEISALVYRSGKADINSCDFNFEINGHVYTQALTGLTITDVIPFTFLKHDSTVSFNNETSLPMKIWFSNLNGNAGINSDTFEIIINVYQDVVQRKVLHEVFTSATCGPCKLGNEILKSIFDANEGKWTCIKYQMNFPGSGDPYYTSECGVRATYYDVLGIPYLAADGNYYNDLPSYYSTQLLIDQSNQPSFISIESDFIKQSKKYISNLKITPLKTYTGNYKLFAAIIESVTRMNSVTGGNGETEFYYVMKKFMTDVNGNNITLTKDQAVNTELLFEFKGNYRPPLNASNPINHEIEHSVENFNNLMLVYWIQNYDTKEVLQSGRVDHATLSIEEFDENENEVKIYPNPSDGNFNIVSDIAFTQLKLRNTLGQEVFSTNASGKEYNMQTRNLSPGLYILQLKTDNGYINKKINTK